jgi:hypothetical protein
VHAYNVTDVLQSHLLFLHVLLRSGRLTGPREGVGARRPGRHPRKVLARIAEGGAARRLLAESSRAASGRPSPPARLGFRPAGAAAPTAAGPRVFPRNRPRAQGAREQKPLANLALLAAWR